MECRVGEAVARDGHVLGMGSLVDKSYGRVSKTQLLEATAVCNVGHDQVCGNTIDTIDIDGPPCKPRHVDLLLFAILAYIVPSRIRTRSDSTRVI